MKNIVLSSIAFALITFSGCADKDPSVDEKKVTKAAEVIKEIPEVKTEVVPSESSIISANEEIQNKTEKGSSLNDAMEEMKSKTDSIDTLASKYSSVYFAFDKFDVIPEMQSNIATAVAASNNVPVEFNIKLEGNCDEWGSDEYNFALGLKRANSVKKSLVAEGIDAKRISMVSYGENNPSCSDKTQECWAKNRRVDFKLLP